ncbi:ADP-ribosylation factor-like GTPase [Encephalitozoon hellem ATCC 50504]|uniref:ADP-ribosylation factor 6 n=1 Tax=Encephalitozoon hellem TaxID=27973 RepID=A0A9Q9CB52_ENCHE|nr:ADP-ribosylation factor-like GTPase [Encephalitozoon hellem ATCC 50504]AFM97935.1 ADP-ribosylation factor-like GTPase [Encephalitozoon hellem ATCC 50504]UTX42739.1 ADP-ribosylation factor 6 [Encephalitozoon hellem]WEL38198.1 GTP-binding domain-containing protein [Encephalitozoon hellem]|eukprot:XP_003886916.1 ADP-ribosylation factor-like GTPase [Encephalitozoon hellem ATCC 50504]
MYFSRIVRRIKKERAQLRILVLGLDNAGKTTVLHKILSKPIEDVRPTFGYKIYDVSYKTVNLVILDIGGQSMFIEYWSSYYEDVDGVVFVFDSSDSRSFIEHIGHIRSTLPSTPMLILANKSDLNPMFDPNQFGKDFSELLEKEDVRLIKCCGIRGDGLESGFDWMVGKATEKLVLDEEVKKRM